MDSREAMSEVLADVLEKFAYMFVDPVQVSEISPEGIDFLAARMEFKGEWSGLFRLILPREACQEVTANILGFDEADDFVKEHLDDGIKELLNIVGAHVLTKVAGDRASFKISIPEIDRLDLAGWSRMMDTGETIALMGDSKPVVLQMIRT